MNPITDHERRSMLRGIFMYGMVVIGYIQALLRFFLRLSSLSSTLLKAVLWHWQPVAVTWPSSSNPCFMYCSTSESSGSMARLAYHEDILQLTHDILIGEPNGGALRLLKLVMSEKAWWLSRLYIINPLPSFFTLHISSMSLHVLNPQDNPESDHSSSRVNAQARGILLNLASTWTGSPILNPVLQLAIDILDIVEVECSYTMSTAAFCWWDICHIGPENVTCATGLLASLHWCSESLEWCSSTWSIKQCTSLAPKNRQLQGVCRNICRRPQHLIRCEIDFFPIFKRRCRQINQGQCFPFSDSEGTVAWTALSNGYLKHMGILLWVAHLLPSSQLTKNSIPKITAEERLVTTDVNRHHDRPPAKPPPSHMQQDQQDHNRGGSRAYCWPKFLPSDSCILTEMFQSSRNLDFTGGTFYSAENVHIGQCLDWIASLRGLTSVSSLL